MFSRVPVLVRSFTYDLSPDVDYIDVVTDPESNDFQSKIPTMLNLSVDLVIQQTPSKLRTQFTMGDFKSGKLIKEGYI